MSVERPGAAGMAEGAGSTGALDCWLLCIGSLSPVEYTFTVQLIVIKCICYHTVSTVNFSTIYILREVKECQESSGGKRWVVTDTIDD